MYLEFYYKGDKIVNYKNGPRIKNWEKNIFKGGILEYSNEDTVIKKYSIINTNIILKTSENGRKKIICKVNLEEVQIT